MISKSREIARGYPLRVRDIGRVGDALCVVRANWDIVEVRDLEGELLMRAEVSSDNELLFHSRMRFAAKRYLLMEVGGGVSAGGFRAWDFVEQRWVLRVHDHWDDVALVGIDSTRALAAVSDGKGIDVFDVAQGQIVWRVPIEGVASFDFNPADPELVVLGGDSFLFGNGELPGAPIAALFVRSELRRHRALPELSWDGPQLAWLDQAHLVSLPDRGALELLNAELEPVRSLGWHLAEESDLRVAGGRWVTLHTPRTTTIVDVEGLHPPRTLQGFAVVTPDGSGAICASVDSVVTERW